MSVLFETVSPAGERYRWLSPPPAFQKFRRRPWIAGYEVLETSTANGMAMLLFASGVVAGTHWAPTMGGKRRMREARICILLWWGKRLARGRGGSFISLGFASCKAPDGRPLQALSLGLGNLTLTAESVICMSRLRRRPQCTSQDCGQAEPRGPLYPHALMCNGRILIRQVSRPTCCADSRREAVFSWIDTVGTRVRPAAEHNMMVSWCLLVLYTRH
jgi:hypothetical protein